MRQKTDSQYADDLEEFIKGSRIKHHLNPCIVVDPSAASFKVELIQRGLWVVDADNDVDNGIRRCCTLMAKRRNRFHRDLVMFQEEVTSYAWDAKASLVGDEKPLKTGDHAMDDYRYINAHLYPEWRMTGSEDTE